MEVKNNSVVDNFKGLVRSSEGFLKSTISKSLNNNGLNHNHTPADILKRLQREAFSELIKIRDKQERLEKLLLYHKFSAGGSSPFHHARTYIKATFNAIGSLLIFEDDFLESADRLEMSSARTGEVSSRLTFETVIRDRDSLIAEFGTSGVGSLGLRKLVYRARVNELFSLVVAPIGAQCGNFGTDSGSDHGQIDDLRATGSPIFHQVHDLAAGITLKGLNFGASIAQLISGPLMANIDSDMNNFHFTTFGQIMWKPLQDLKFSLSSLWQMRRPSGNFARISSLTVPLIHLKRSRESEVQIQATSAGSPQSVGLILDAKYLDSTELKCWVEVDEPGHENVVKFGVSYADLPENELGWGLRVFGQGKGSLSRVERFQTEGFLNLNLGKIGNAKLQPGLVFITEGGSRVAAVVMRSSWTM